MKSWSGIFFAILIISVLPGCSVPSLKAAFHPTVQDKRFAVERSRDLWEKATPFSSYGYARSLQLLEVEGFAMAESGSSYHGGTGTAALITADGYALTAAHVLRGSRQPGIVELTDKARRLHLITLPKKKKDDERRIVFLKFPDPERLSDQERRKISVKTARVIHYFAGRDLALIKLPPSEAPFFKIGRMPSRGHWVFSSGSGISAAPFPTAGKVVKIARNGRRFLAQMPSAMGDSGGPVFNAHGELVGIFSKLTPEGAGEWKGIRWFQSSCCEVPEKNEIENLIAADRSR